MIIKIQLICLLLLSVANCRTMDIQSKDYHYLKENEKVSNQRFKDLGYDLLDIISLSFEFPAIGAKVIVSSYEFGIFGEGLPQTHQDPIALGLGLRSSNNKYLTNESVFVIKSYHNDENRRKQEFPNVYGRNKEYTNEKNPDELNTYIYGRFGFEIAFIIGIRFEVNFLEIIDFVYNIADKDLLKDNFESYNPPNENKESIEIEYNQLNRLEDIPIVISKLKNLKKLKLRNQNIKSIPPFIGNLKKLEFLDISYNEIKELPNEFKNLENLKELSILSFEIISNLDILCSLQKIKKLEISGNTESLKFIEKGCLKNLNALIIKKGGIKKNIANSIKSDFQFKENSKLNYLYIEDITSLPASIKNLPNLEELYLGNYVFPNDEIKSLKSINYLRFIGWEIDNDKREKIKEAWKNVLPNTCKIN
ncbi:leucine-rich repeat domain-containing protein [Leptospira sp. WS39.C2]